MSVLEPVLVITRGIVLVEPTATSPKSAVSTWTEPMVRVGKSALQTMKARQSDTTIKDLFHVAISYLLLSFEYR
jgi:hypothetical protein